MKCTTAGRPPLVKKLTISENCQNIPNILFLELLYYYYSLPLYHNTQIPFCQEEIQKNLTNFYFYDIIIIENKKGNKIKNSQKGIDKPKITWYNKEKRKEISKWQYQEKQKERF